ncbi:MAG: hypothetical protein E7391_01295 [Ruminococcaceae bacterium]|nr:hypothetical protein [Oscillospiraceae bacterium]
MKYCKNCKKQVFDEFSYCPYCSVPLEVEKKTASQNLLSTEGLNVKKKKSKKPILILSIILAVVLIASAITIFVVKSKKPRETTPAPSGESAQTDVKTDEQTDQTTKKHPVSATSVNSRGVEYKYTYDENGNKTYEENSNGNWWKYTYDENGNKTYQEDSYGDWAKFTYDKNGNNTYREDSDGDFIKYTYEHAIIGTREENPVISGVSELVPFSF